MLHNLNKLMICLRKNDFHQSLDKPSDAKKDVWTFCTNFTHGVFNLKVQHNWWLSVETLGNNEFMSSKDCGSKRNGEGYHNERRRERARFTFALWLHLLEYPTDWQEMLCQMESQAALLLFTIQNGMHHQSQDLIKQKPQFFKQSSQPFLENCSLDLVRTDQRLSDTSKLNR